MQRPFLVVLLFVASAAASSSQTPAQQPKTASTTSNTERTSPKQEPSETIWQRTTTDPIALYTLVLAIFTGLLFIVSAIQGGFLLRADKTARITAEAARKSADIAAAAQRALVFGKGFDVASNRFSARIKEYVFWVKWENVGPTPATDVRSWINYQAFPVAENREPSFGQLRGGASTVFGPQTTGQSEYMAIPLATMIENWRRETEIYVWSRVEYRDVLNPSVIHHHEQCARVQLLRDPAIVEEPSKAEKSLSIVSFLVYGPQNSSS